MTASVPKIQTLFFFLIQKRLKWTLIMTKYAMRIFWKHQNQIAELKAEKCLTSHCSPFSCCLSVVFSLKKGPTAKIRIFRFQIKLNTKGLVLKVWLDIYWILNWILWVTIMGTAWTKHRLGAGLACRELQSLWSSAREVRARKKIKEAAYSQLWHLVVFQTASPANRHSPNPVSKFNI